MASNVATGGAGGGAQTGISFPINADTKNVARQVQPAQKALRQTGETAKKAGNEGQKAMEKWGKALDKAGSSAYDFGNQVFSSMTVTGALQEYITGSIEQGVMELFDGDEGDLRTLGLIIGGPLGFGVAIAMEETINNLNTLFDLAGTRYGSLMGLRLSTEVSTALTNEDYAKKMAAAMATEDWTGVQTLLTQKMSEGKFTAVDEAIQNSIGLGDYSTARAALDKALSSGDFNLNGLNDAIDKWTASFSTKASALFNDPILSPAAMLEASMMKVDYARATGRAIEAFKGANWDSATDSIEPALEKWGAKFAEIVTRHLKDIQGGLEITVAETVQSSGG